MFNRDKGFSKNEIVHVCFSLGLKFLIIFQSVVYKKVIFLEMRTEGRGNIFVSYFKKYTFLFYFSGTLMRGPSFAFPKQKLGRVSSLYFYFFPPRQGFLCIISLRFVGGQKLFIAVQFIKRTLVTTFCSPQTTTIGFNFFFFVSLNLEKFQYGRKSYIIN